MKLEDKTLNMSEINKKGRKNWFTRFFLNERIMLSLILVNTIAIFIEESGIQTPFLLAIDLSCTLIFLVEMIVKHTYYGFKGYWTSVWNRMDGILVILSSPSLLLAFFPEGNFDLSVLLIIRLLRVLRVFRLTRFFPNFQVLIKNLRLAMSQTRAIFLAFFVIILVFGLINCVIFRQLAPEFFATPLKSLYSVFRLCTLEGWYEIPDTIATATSPFWGNVVRTYFCVFLILGGVIGMSFINSIFVDAMVSDNNDDVKAQLKEMEEKIDRLLEENERLKAQE